MLFELGQVVITPAAERALIEAGTEADAFLARHHNGDWGNLDKEDRDENWIALDKRYRIISVYLTSTGSKIWIITERDRSTTTILLPEEYPKGIAKIEGGLA